MPRFLNKPGLRIASRSGNHSPQRLQEDSAWLSALHKKRNPTHGSGWIDSDTFYRQLPKSTVIPPTAVGGYFKSVLREDLNNPPTSVGGIRRSLLSLV